MLLRSFALLLLVGYAHAHCHDHDVVKVDFSRSSNPAVAMEWTDAAGNLYTGQWMIPSGATDASGGAFPGGSVRWKNVGVNEGSAFDLVMTVSPRTSYENLLELGYVSPTSATQAATLESGFVCLGVGVETAQCASGASLLPATATCSDGTQTIMRGAEFELRFVHNGTDQLMNNFTNFFVTNFGACRPRAAPASALRHQTMRTTF